MITLTITITVQEFKTFKGSREVKEEVKEEVKMEVKMDNTMIPNSRNYRP